MRDPVAVRRARFSRTVSRRRLALAPAAAAASLACLALAGCGGSSTVFANTTNSTNATNATNTTNTTNTTHAPTQHPAPKHGSPEHRVDTKQLEHAIATSARAQRHLKTTVVCPPSFTGDSFYCAAQSAGEVTPFLVTHRAGGKLSYRGVPATTTPSVDMPEIEIEIAQAVRADHRTARSVTWPQEMPRQQGLAFVCAVTTGPGKPTRYVVTEVNALGRVTFRAA
jgi:hypothetical protein